MTDEAWNSGFVHCLGVRLAGAPNAEVDERGEPIVGDTLCLLLNAHHEPIKFALPPPGSGHFWERLLDTANPGADAAPWQNGEYPLQDRSLAVFRLASAPQPVAAEAAQTATADESVVSLVSAFGVPAWQPT
jgi:glycogen operon protein